MAKITTNADRIRSMTDEELAEFIYEISNTCNKDIGACINCKNIWCERHELDNWLRKQIERDGEEG